MNGITVFMNKYEIEYNDSELHDGDDANGLIDTKYCAYYEHLDLTGLLEFRHLPMNHIKTYIIKLIFCNKRNPKTRSLKINFNNMSSYMVENSKWKLKNKEETKEFLIEFMKIKDRILDKMNIDLINDMLAKKGIYGYNCDLQTTNW